MERFCGKIRKAQGCYLSICGRNVVEMRSKCGRNEVEMQAMNTRRVELASLFSWFSIVYKRQKNDVFRVLYERWCKIFYK